MTKSKLIILVFLCFFYTQKLVLSQICLEHQSNGKIVQLDTSRIVKMYSEGYSYQGKIITFNDTSFTMSMIDIQDSILLSTNYDLLFDDIDKLTYCRKKDQDKCQKGGKLILPISIGAGLVGFFIVGQFVDHPAVIGILPASFFAPIVIGELTKPKVYKTQKKWKIMVCS